MACPRAYPLLGGASVPSDGFGVVLLDPTTVRVHEAEVGLPAGVSLLGGASVPADGFGVVLLNPTTGLVPHTEAALRVGLSLLGQQAKRGDVELGDGVIAQLQSFRMELPLLSCRSQVPGDRLHGDRSHSGRQGHSGTHEEKLFGQRETVYLLQRDDAVERLEGRVVVLVGSQPFCLRQMSVD